jgi:hypothetical protein
VDQHPIDFDGDDPLGTLQQTFGKCTAPGSDFDDKRIV